MSDADLKILLEKAFLPYARGYATNPDEVDLEFSVTPTQVHGTLRYGADDYEAVTSGSLAEVDIQRAFRTLTNWNDGRRPSLSVEKRP
jgi:hypothetical protein